MTMSDGLLWTGPVDSPHRYQVRVDAVAEAVAGGEGLVYRADDTDRGVPVALKLLTVVNVADYGRIVERSVPFTRITHPNLMSHVEVFIGTGLTNDPNPDIADFDVIYTVADWIEGQSLPDVVEAADTRRLLGFIAGIARGLDALHRHRSPDAPLGIVHRDVKPSNVRVTRDGAAVLIDFGVARPLDHGDLTQGVGTYRWRAPEVLSGSAAIGTAVDVWGLGAVAYWALTGQPPSLDGAAAAREHLIHTPRCQELVDPVGVATHIAVLLTTDPARRPTDLSRWASQLEAIVTGRRRGASRIPSMLGRGALAAAAVGAGLGVNASVGAWALDRLTPTNIDVDPRIVVVSNDGPAYGTSYGDVVRLLELGGARAVGLVEFNSAEFADGASGRSDVVVSTAMRDLAVGPLIDIAVTYRDGQIPVLSRYRVDPLASELARAGLPTGQRRGVVRSVLGLARVAPLVDGAVVVVPDAKPDREADAATTVVPGVFLWLAALGTGTEVSSPTPNGVRIGAQRVRLEHGDMIVRWSDQLDAVGDPSVVASADVYSNADPERFKDAIVLVGPIDPASSVVVDTPVGALPEVLVQANALNTVLTEQYSRNSAAWWSTAAGIAATLAIVSTPNRHRRLMLPATASTIALGWLIVARSAADRGLRVHALTVPVAAVAAALLVGLGGQLVAMSNRRRMQVAFASSGVPAAGGRQRSKRGEQR